MYLENSIVTDLTTNDDNRITKAV